jgi:hypothetical protein
MAANENRPIEESANSTAPVEGFAFDRSKSIESVHLDAHRIAFAPVVFKVVQVMRRSGLLRSLVNARRWIATDELQPDSGFSAYALTIVLETAYSAGLIERRRIDSSREVEWKATQLGRVIERDALVGANLDFVDDVCYRALDHLDQALREEKPVGLQELGDWATFYQGMSELPEPARSSWFRFDHLYSDSAFPQAIDIVAATAARHIADVGANTGRFAVEYLQRVADSRVSLCDLPQQLELARIELAQRGLLARARLHPCDVLDPSAQLPSGADAPDAFWMSQFLCCFSENEVVDILARAAAAVRAGGSIFVLDTFWDDQRHPAAAYCLINTSPYFSTVANGKGRMYRLDVLLDLARAAGLDRVRTWHSLGVSHTLIELKPGPPSPGC